MSKPIGAGEAQTKKRIRCPMPFLSTLSIDVVELQRQVLLSVADGANEAGLQGYRVTGISHVRTVAGDQPEVFLDVELAGRRTQ